MKIKYNNLMEHLVQWNMHNLSGNFKRTKILFLGSIYVFTFVVIGIIEDFNLEPIPIIGTLIGLLIVSIYMWKSFDKSIKKQITKQYSQSDNNNILCEHEIEVNLDHIIERTAHGETSTEIKAIEKVTLLDDYIYIHIASIMAHIVPRDSITNGDFNQFKEHLLQIKSLKFEQGIGV